ncbi:hypothetical protein [Acidithiobacillus sp.]
MNSLKSAEVDDQRILQRAEAVVPRLSLQDASLAVIIVNLMLIFI